MLIFKTSRTDAYSKESVVRWSHQSNALLAAVNVCKQQTVVVNGRGNRLAVPRNLLHRQEVKRSQEVMTL